MAKPKKGRLKKRVKRTRASVCGEKTQYPSRAAAEQMRRNYIRTGSSPDLIRAYQCKFCKYFHVGHMGRSDFRQVQNRVRQWK
jgi:hypothetical protein